jgi:hypothetical protein
MALTVDEIVLLDGAAHVVGVHSAGRSATVWFAGSGEQQVL